MDDIELSLFIAETRYNLAFVILNTDYWKELIRPPILVIAVGSFGAYLAHPYMQAGAALYVNAGYSPGGILSGIW